jgi:hypothetical protein
MYLIFDNSKIMLKHTKYPLDILPLMLIPFQHPPNPRTTMERDDVELHSVANGSSQYHHPMFLIDGGDEAAGYSMVRDAIVGWWEATKDRSAAAAAMANLVGWEARYGELAIGKICAYLPRGFQDDLVEKSNVVRGLGAPRLL